ncbi:MAG TPA: glycosyltransferase [Candidatus Limnocylindrales bacterium]|nr:glycosyltransferase [Candidatus Limnocylindrales bacterium]
MRSTDIERSRATVAWLEAAGIARAVLVRPAAAPDEPPPALRLGGATVQVAATRSEAVAVATSDGASSIAGPHLLFLHDDVRPLAERAVARLRAGLESRPDLAAVAGQLILPRRLGPARGPATDPADLTVGEAGVAFEPRAGRPAGIRLGRGSAPRINAAVTDVAAASAAALLVRAGAVRSEDLDRDDDHDLSVALAVGGRGGSVGVAGDAAFFHDEAAEPSETMPPPWLGRLRRALLLDRLEGAGTWSPQPFHLGITVTRNDASAGYGDWYTAHELGDAVERLGWRVTYLERHQDHWYRLPDDLDALVVLIDLYDLSRVPAGVIRIAWARNWMDHWIEREWFDDYDLVLVSSSAAKAMVDARTAALAHVFPIATNPERFHPGPARDELGTDVAFVGSHFGRPRGVAAGLPAIAAAGGSVGVWGRDWETVEGMAELTRGQVAYDGVPDVYRSTRLVVDDNLATTLELGMLNSRVFDALATGALILTNNVTGVRDLFDDEFPTWSDATELETTAVALLADDDRRRSLVERYQRVVLERHTYKHRAEELRSLLTDWASAERWAIATGPRNREAARTWGDTYFARAVQRQLARRGRPTTVWVHDEWPAAGGGADVVIHLFGARAPTVHRGPANVLWVISHPERITPEACAGYDRVAVASDRFAANLASGTAVPVLPLHQATDPDRFHPTEGGPMHEVLFVGSSRGQRRPVVDAAAASGHDLAVYGGGWTDELIDLRYLRGAWVPNDELAAWYSSAAIVLTDHYDDMRELGFISNRVYDALACRTLVVSDDVAGLDEEFDGAVVVCRTPEEVGAALDRYLADSAGRTDRAERGRAAVVARHTFGHRVETLIATVEPVLAERPDERRRSS